MKKTVDGVSVFMEFDLFPINRDKPYSKVSLEIIKDNLKISSIKQVGKDGNNYTIKVKNMQINTPMNDSMFVFDKEANPDVDVIDMRIK